MWEGPMSKNTKKCSFWLKPWFSVWFFNCDRNQGLKLPKTAVFSAVFNCGRSQELKLPKTAVFSAVFKCGRSHSYQKQQFSAENHSFQMGEEPKPKTVVFSQKPQVLAKNCSFLCGFQMWEEPKPKTTVFSWKLWFSVWFLNVGGAKAKNRGFWPKTVFSVVFKCGRSQSQKPWFLAKTAAKNHGFQCGFQMWEEPKPKTAVSSLKNRGFQNWEEPSWKLQFSAKNRGFLCGFQMWEEPRPKNAVFGWKPRFLT